MVRCTINESPTRSSISIIRHAHSPARSLGNLEINVVSLDRPTRAMDSLECKRSLRDRLIFDKNDNSFCTEKTNILF